MAHSYITSNQANTGTFISIEALNSQVNLNKISLETNFISQNTLPFISIDCLILKIVQFVCNQNNFQINENFIIRPTQDYNNAYITDMINNRFQVLSNVGIGILSSTSLIIQNSQFINGYSNQISIFKLIIKSNSSILMNNIEIQNYSSSMQQDKLLYGCFFIDNSYYDLNLTLDNITVSGIISRFQSAFLYLQASTGLIQAYIKNCKMENIFSLKNSLISMDLKESFSTNNLVVIKNVTIINDQSHFYSFLSKLISLSETELQILKSKSGLVFITNAKVFLYNFHFSGYIISPLFEFTECYDILIKQIELDNIQLLSSLMIFSSNSSTSVKIQQLKINKIKQLISEQSSKSQIDKLQYELTSQIDCQLQFRQNIDSIFENHQFINQIDPEALIFQLQNQISGIIKISQNKNNLIISNSYFQGLTCSYCQYGGFFIESSQNSNITITNTIFLQGSYKSLGSIYINGDQTNSIDIDTCKFESNQCNQGCGVYINKSKATIRNSQFIRNKAKNLSAGIYYEGVTLNLTGSSFTNNTALLGSALYLTNLKLQIQQLVTNQFIDNSEVQIREIPSYLNCYYNENKLKKETAENGTELLEMAQDIIYLPSSIPFSEYKRFNEKTLKYNEQQFSLQFIPLNQQQERQIDFVDSLCNYSLLLIDINSEQTSSNILTKTINYNSNEYSYHIDEITFDPYYPDNYISQIQVKCNLMDSYTYSLNIQQYFCQMGEYYSQQGCHYCESSKGYYSVKANSTKCSQIDTNKILNNTVNLLKLKPGFWRIDIHSEQFEECATDSCLGGWQTGQDSCKEGYIGALCQECDLENFYTLSQTNSCLPCKESWGSIISLTLLSLWMLISIALTVKSVQFANNQFKLLVLTNRFYQILQKYNQDVAGCLIKMLQNSMLIVGAVYSVQQNLMVNMNWIESLSAPTLTNAFSLDCWFSRQTYVDMLYLRMFLLVILSLFFISLFISGYLIFVSIQKIKYDSSTLVIAIIYIFIITQSDNIRYSSSLIASRTISDIRWVQQNISYKYDTDTHYYWIMLVAIPLLIIWGILVPLFFAFILIHNRKILMRNTFRRKWSYLFQEYQTNSYYWEIVKIVSRELQILVLTIFKLETLNNICLLFFIEFIYLRLIGKIQPYNMEELNQLEIESVQKCILILILGLFTFSSSNNDIKMISEIMLIFATVSLIIPFILKLIKIYFQKYLISFRSVIQKFQFMKQILQLTSQDLERKRRARERFIKVKAKLMNRVQTFQRFERVYNESLITDQTTNTFNKKLQKLSQQLGIQK